MRSRSVRAPMAVAITTGEGMYPSGETWCSGTTT